MHYSVHEENHQLQKLQNQPAAIVRRVSYLQKII